MSSYFDHIDQVKRGLRPRSPRPSGPVVRNGRAASLGGIFAFNSPHGLSIPVLFSLSITNNHPERRPSYRIAAFNMEGALFPLTRGG